MRHVVLIVDDDPAIRQVIEETVETFLRMETASAGSGGEALALTEIVRPAAIVLDLRMPDMDGFEVMKALKSRPETECIPVIVSTANPRTGEAALAAGAVACVAKPFDLEELAAVVRRHVPDDRVAMA